MSWVGKEVGVQNYARGGKGGESSGRPSLEGPSSPCFFGGKRRRGHRTFGVRRRKGKKEQTGILLPRGGKGKKTAFAREGFSSFSKKKRERGPAKNSLKKLKDKERDRKEKKDRSSVINNADYPFYCFFKFKEKRKTLAVVKKG